MTVITVANSDPGFKVVRWEVPEEKALQQSPIPRGVRHYRGSAPIAALGANDETLWVLTLTFPTAFQYMLKSLTVNFLSDDLTTEFDNLGLLEYRPGGSTSLGVIEDYLMQADGVSNHLATRAMQVYRPQGTWRKWITGPDNDTVVISLTDISNDTSTAGDVAWSAEAWEYDVEQCLRWPVNTPQPTLPL